MAEDLKITNINTNSNQTSPKNLDDLTPLCQSNSDLNENLSKNSSPFFLMILEDNNGESKQIKIFEDSDPSELAFYFCKENNLDYSSMKYIETNIKEILKKFNTIDKKELIYLSNDSIKEEDEEKYGTEETIKSIINEKAPKNNENEKNETNSHQLLLNLLNKKITLSQLKINAISPMQVKIKDLITKFNNNNYYMILDDPKNEKSNQNKKITTSIKIKYKKDISSIKKNNYNNNEKNSGPVSVEKSSIIKDKNLENIKLKNFSEKTNSFSKDKIKKQKPKIVTDLGDYYCYRNSVTETNGIINNGNIININNNNNFNYNYNYSDNGNIIAKKPHSHKNNYCIKRNNMEYAKKVYSSRYRDFVYYMLSPLNSENSNSSFYINTNVSKKKHKTIYQDNANDDSGQKTKLTKGQNNNKQSYVNKKIISNSYIKDLKRLLTCYLPEYRNKNRHHSKKFNRTNISNNINIPENISRISKCKNMSLNIKNLKKNISVRNSYNNSYLNQISKPNQNTNGNSKTLNVLDIKPQILDLGNCKSQISNSSRGHSKKYLKPFYYRDNGKQNISKFVKYKKMNKNILNKKSNTCSKNTQKIISIIDEDVKKAIKNNNSANINTEILDHKKTFLSNKDYYNYNYNFNKTENLFKNQESIKKLKKNKNSILINGIKTNLTMNNATNKERETKLQSKKLKNAVDDFRNALTNISTNKVKIGKHNTTCNIKSNEISKSILHNTSQINKKKKIKSEGKNTFIRNKDI